MKEEPGGAFDLQNFRNFLNGIARNSLSRIPYKLYLFRNSTAWLLRGMRVRRQGASQGIDLACSPEPPMRSALPLSPGRGVERYRVRGGGLVALEMAEGDEVSVVDVEGRQFCEIFVFGSDGRPDPGAAGLDADFPSE